MCYSTIPDVDDGFGDFTPVCGENTHPRADPQSRAYAAISGKSLIGPVIEVHVVQHLGNHGLEIKIQPPNNPDQTSWVQICRGKNRFVNELHIPDRGHNLTSSELFSEQAICKRKWTLFCRIGAIQHWGHPCETIPESFRSSMLDERNHTFIGKEVDKCSCLSIIQKVQIIINRTDVQKERTTEQQQKTLISLREKQGRTNTYIPKHVRTRQSSTLDPDLQKLEWLSPNWKTYFTTPTSSSSSSWSQSWW